jgi:hypothetical protein
VSASGAKPAADTCHLRRVTCRLGRNAAPGASGDCFTPVLPRGDLPIVDFLARCRVATTDGFEIRYLDRAYLIRMRRLAVRVRDLRRAEALERLATT